jgi:hypothetical protein
MKTFMQMLRMLSLAVVLIVPFLSSTAAAKPSHEAAQKELPYLRMSLAMNSSLHLVQLPLHWQRQLELTRERAFVSFGGGLVYAGAAALTFTKSRRLQHAGIYTFMGTSLVGAGFVSYGLVGCAIREEPNCAASSFNALNALILANQIVGWTLGVRQVFANKEPEIARAPLQLSLFSGRDSFMLHVTRSI